MSDSHTWTKNCVLCGGDCRLAATSHHVKKHDAIPPPATDAETVDTGNGETVEPEKHAAKKHHHSDLAPKKHNPHK